MSLVGNLEDLSLGDIMQIISLSQKSGVLALACDQGSGRIVFHEGLVIAAGMKGGPGSLRDLLVGGEFIDPAGYDDVVVRSRDQGISIEEGLASIAGLPTARVETLIRDSAEAVIIEMFTWPAGDFSFDVRSELDPEDPKLILSNGLNAQYLAMEGLRLRDERDRDASSEVDPDAVTNPRIEPVPLDPIFGSDSLETDADDLGTPFLAAKSMPEVESPAEGSPTSDPPVLDSIDSRSSTPSRLDPAASRDGNARAADTLVARVIERLDTPEDLTDPSLVAKPEAVEANPGPKPSVANPPRVASAKKTPVVLIDPDVGVLEWVKSAIENDFARVHVFQQADQGLARIRQYLIRGETPLVLISAETQIDPLSGIHGLADFVKRLKAQAPRLVVLGLREDAATAPSAMPSALDGVLGRPARQQPVEGSQAEGSVDGQGLLQSLLEIIAEHAVRERPSKDAPREAGVAAIRDATAKLQEASSRGEILPVVLDFAFERFARVAILIIREDVLFAVAGRGLPVLEVDALDSAKPISLQTLGAGWVRTVLDSGKPHVGPPRTPADRALVKILGGEAPEQAYLGPIESGSSVIALLYCDQVTSGAPMPDTSGIEVVLHHAGLALDRAALERALWEVEADGRKGSSPRLGAIDERDRSTILVS